MTEYTATRAAATKPVAGGSAPAQTKRTQYGTIEVTANPAPGDVFNLVRLPKGAVILGGRVLGDKLDSIGTGSALLDMDIGINDGGTVDTDALGNFGVWNGAAVAGIKPEAGYNMPLGGLLMQSGPVSTSYEALVQATVVASALAFSSGTLSIEVDYYVP
jgi:hypothetical protein